MVGCCVPYCEWRKDRKLSLHRFPTNDGTNRYEIWLARVGRIDLFMKSLKSVRNCYRVCYIHFSQEQKIKNFYRNKSPLRRNAVPDVHLPYEPRMFLPPSVLRDHNYSSVFSGDSINFYTKGITNLELDPIVSPLAYLDEDFLNIKSKHICLFCMRVLEESNEVNIQMIVTKKGKIVEDFLRATLLHIGTEHVLESYYICSGCSDLVNTFEEYFNRSNAIQDTLVKQYVEHRNLKGHKKCTKQDGNILQEEMQDFSIICDNKEFSTVSTQTDDNNQFEYTGGTSILECLLTEGEIKEGLDRFGDDDFRWDNNENVEPEHKNKGFLCDSITIANPVLKCLTRERKKRLRPKKVKPPPPDLSNGYCCHQCGKIFWKYKAYQRHDFYHRNEGRFPCEVCSKTFATKLNYENHTITHTDLRPFKCDSCEKAFRTRQAVNFHKLSRHPNAADANGFCCDKCGQVYTSYYGFSLHLRRHKNENLFRCEICDKTFSQGANLKKHQMIHFDIRPFKCGRCNKTFRCKPQLNAHMDRHNGIRKYHCETCGKSFFTRSNLRNHQNIHLTIKPFPCPMCGRRFAHRVNMKSHIKIHAKHENE